MKFSELSLAEKDSGLTFDKERLMLIGAKNGYGVTIADTDDEYCLKVFAEKPFTFEKEIQSGIIKLSESLSKNTINSQRCEYGYVEVKLCKGCLLQEKLVLLIDFLDKLTELLNSLDIKGSDPLVPKIEKKESSPKPQNNVKKIKLGFNFNSIKGLFGAVLGGFAMVFISSMLISYSENTNTSLLSSVGYYMTSIAATALIFFDYRFLAKKLDAFGIITCPIISVLTAVFSSVTVGAKSAAKLTGCTFADGFGKITEYYEISPDFASFLAGYLVQGVIISVLASIIICIWYFNRHPDDMFKNEKIIGNDEKSIKK